MVSFIDENKDFVLKLKINLENDKTQIRRVCLPRIADEHGNVSYEELVGLVLVFTLPEEVDDAGVTAGNNKYTVSLSYYDKEKDLITVASTVELMDAINLFAGQKFMRISTCVLNKISYSAAAAAAAAFAIAALFTASSASAIVAGSPEAFAAAKSVAANVSAAAASLYYTVHVHAHVYHPFFFFKP